MHTLKAVTYASILQADVENNRVCFVLSLEEPYPALSFGHKIPGRVTTHSALI